MVRPNDLDARDVEVASAHINHGSFTKAKSMVSGGGFPTEMLS